MKLDTWGIKQDSALVEEKRNDGTGMAVTAGSK
jgi:hypothetical protein